MANDCAPRNKRMGDANDTLKPEALGSCRLTAEGPGLERVGLDPRDFPGTGVTGPGDGCGQPCKGGMVSAQENGSGAQQGTRSEVDRPVGGEAQGIPCYFCKADLHFGWDAVRCEEVVSPRWSA